MIYFLLIQIAAAGEPRIVSLNPAITENLFALGLGSFVVGTTSYSDYPPEAKRLPKVGDHQFSAEKILSLRPTHIINISDRFGVDRSIIERSDIKPLTLKLETLTDFPKALDELGRQFSKIDESKRIVKEWDESWKKITRAEKSLKVLIQVQAQPVIAAGSETFLDEVLKKCGHNNVISYPRYPHLNRETILKLKPDIILMLSNDTSMLKLGPAKRIRFNPDQVSRLTPRLPTAVKDLCRVLEAS